MLVSLHTLAKLAGQLDRTKSANLWRVSDFVLARVARSPADQHPRFLKSPHLEHSLSESSFSARRHRREAIKR